MPCQYAAHKVDVIADMRYAMQTELMDPLWGIQFDETDKNRPAIRLRLSSKERARLKELYTALFDDSGWIDINAQEP